MNVTVIIQQHKKICELVNQKKIKQSFDIIEGMLAYASSGALRDEFEDIKMTYRNILKYTIEGVVDPERKKIYNKCMQDLLRLADRLKQDILARYSGWYTYSVRRADKIEDEMRGITLANSIDDLAFKSELDKVLVSADITSSDPESDLFLMRKRLTGNIFNHLWLSDYYGEAEKGLTEIIRQPDRFQWHEQALFVSAITLSSLRVWDPEKVKILALFYSDGISNVSERAIVGLVLSLYQHNERLSLYNDLMEIVYTLAEQPYFRDRCLMIVLQVIRSRETERLSKRMNEEIIPKVAKMQPRIDEKLDLDAILGEETGEGPNPDWSDMFKESEEIFRTMEELAKLQMEGSDVYMSAFASLKNFTFFKEFRNWFTPFYPDHEAVDLLYKDEILGPEINELAEALFKTPFICNSDKFSLILNLRNLPAAQKSMMQKVFKMELEGLEQMKYDNELTDPHSAFKTSITQYIHDLYRFYKLSDFRNEVDDLFRGRLDIYNSFFFRSTCSSDESDAALADYFFNKDFYDDALSLYLSMLRAKPDDAQLNEKAAYCYQQQGHYEEALEYYRTANIINPKPWTLKKSGLCLRRLDRTAEALDCYIQAGEMDNEDLHTTLMTAHCYLDLHDYESAIKNYFRIEYSDPGNNKVIRPIAWCYLATGRFDESARYFDKIGESKLTSHDRINIGHLELCRGNKQKAAGNYMVAIATGNMNIETFISVIRDDSEILVNNGVNPEDLPLIVDYVLMSLNR